ncbi:HEPN domain-containing protein [Desulfoplanes sp. PS50]|jgi:HEPN domain-containing protein
MEPNIDKLIRFWISEAVEALKVADHLVEKGDFSYALFFGHLALEKMLKALCVKEQRGHAPPIHNLIRLAKIAGIKLDKQAENDFVTITAFNIESRYPDFKNSFRKKCTLQFTTQQMETIKRYFKWLKSQLS